MIEEPESGDGADHSSVRHLSADYVVSQSVSWRHITSTIKVPKITSVPL